MRGKIYAVIIKREKVQSALLLKISFIVLLIYGYRRLQYVVRLLLSGVSLATYKCIHVIRANYYVKEILAFASFLGVGPFLFLNQKDHYSISFSIINYKKRGLITNIIIFIHIFWCVYIDN